MSQYIIEGNHTISGEIKVEGAKNSILPILSAALVTGGITKLTNCPDLSDVRNTLIILEKLGCKTEFSGGCISIDSSRLTSSTIPSELASSIRSSVTFIGALTARCGNVATAHPGECATPVGT